MSRIYDNDLDRIYDEVMFSESEHQEEQEEQVGGCQAEEDLEFHEPEAKKTKWADVSRWFTPMQPSLPPSAKMVRAQALRMTRLAVELENAEAQERDQQDQQYQGDQHGGRMHTRSTRPTISRRSTRRRDGSRGSQVGRIAAERRGSFGPIAPSRRQVSCMGDDLANNFVETLVEIREQLSKLDTSHGDKMSTEGRTELRKILKSHAELVEEMEPKLQAGFQQPFGPHRSNSWATVDVM